MQTGGLRTKGITKASQSGKPLISVVTVVRNGAATLEQTILSVVNQTYDNVEYIVIDGASTDGTLDVIRKYEDRIDLWQSEPDGGIYDAMNKGIALATGGWVLFLGADDVLFDAYVIKNVSKRLININCVYYGDVFFDTHRLIYDYKFSAVKLCCRNICHQAIFYPKTIYNRMHFDTRYRIHADWEYNIKAWKLASFVYIPVMISIFCETGSSAKGDVVFLEDKHRIIKENLGFFVYVKSMLVSPFQRYWYCLKHFFDSYRYR